MRFDFVQRQAAGLGSVALLVMVAAQAQQVVPTAPASPTAPTASSASLTPAARPSPCGTSNHRAFDFWIGEWMVYGKTGKLVGENRIEKRHGGCMLHESYATPAGYTGESINMYDASRQRWVQTWADNGGLLLRLEGGLREGSMVMEGESLLSGGRQQAQRITWTPQADGTVRQHWEAKNDQGQWTTQFDGTYRKK